DGSLAAFVVGMVIGIFGDVTWLFLLLFFLLSSFLATRYRFALKEALGVQEGVRGERRSTNVLANGVALMGVAVLSLAASAAFSKVVSGIVFLSALSVAGADTLASEIGVLSRRTVLITNGQPVPPGTDGGVSVLGTLCAFGAAAYTALVVDTEDRLRPRRAEQDGPIFLPDLNPVRRVDLPALGEFHDRCEDRLPPIHRHRHVRLLDVVQRQRRDQRRKGLTLVREELEHFGGRHRAVAAELMFRKDRAAVLFPAKHRAGLEHRARDDRGPHPGPDD